MSSGLFKARPRTFVQPSVPMISSLRGSCHDSARGRRDGISHMAARAFADNGPALLRACRARVRERHRAASVSRNEWCQRVSPALEIGAHVLAHRFRARPALPSAPRPPARIAGRDRACTRRARDGNRRAHGCRREVDSRSRGCASQRRGGGRSQKWMAYVDVRIHSGGNSCLSSKQSRT